MQARSKPVSFSKGKSVPVVGLIANASSKHRWKMKVALFLFRLICLAPCWKYRVVFKPLRRGLVRTGWGIGPSTWIRGRALVPVGDLDSNENTDATPGTLTRDAAELSRALTARAVMVSRLACRPWDADRQQ